MQALFERIARAFRLVAAQAHGPSIQLRAEFGQRLDQCVDAFFGRPAPGKDQHVRFLAGLEFVGIGGVVMHDHLLVRRAFGEQFAADEV